jgi:hypothetical protein
MKWLAVSYRMSDTNEKNLFLMSAGNQAQTVLWMADLLPSFVKQTGSSIDKQSLQLSTGDTRFIRRPTDATDCDNAR